LIQYFLLIKSCAWAEKETINYTKNIFEKKDF